MPHARQLRAGFPWLTFDGELEPEFRPDNVDENLPHIRVNFCLATLIIVAISAMDATVLSRNSTASRACIHMLVIIPMLLLGPRARASRRAGIACIRRSRSSAMTVCRA